MTTFSTSPRLLKAYKNCRGLYIGMGRVGAKPKKLRVSAFFSKRRPGRMNMFLTAIG